MDQSLRQPHDSEPVVPVRVDLMRGDRVGNHEIVDKLGEGTFGLVYKVRRVGSAEWYALKLLKLWEVIEAEDQKMVSKRFHGEYRCGQLPSRYLVQTLEEGRLKGNPYILMNYMAGGDLRQRMTEFTRWDDINQLAQHILYGLKDLHENGIIHRDLKPENVMLDGQRRALLSDFGIAGFINARITVPRFFGQVRETFGTYAYIAPEQLKDARKFKTTSARTDLFSFGVMMYEVISQGHYPFGQLSNHALLADYIRRAAEGRTDDIRHYRPDVPDYWSSLLHHCLHPHFENRLATVDEALRLLSGISLPPPVAPLGVSFQPDLTLVITQGEEPGRQYHLGQYLPITSNGIIRIGWYDPAQPNRNQVEIRETATSYISNFHATLEKSIPQQRWLLRDGQYRQREGVWGWYPSKNQVFVNAKPIDTAGVAIYPGDLITLGDTTLKVMVTT